MRTDFLPDARRAAAEEELRAQLKKEYTLRQQVAWPVADSTSMESATDILKTTRKANELHRCKWQSSDAGFGGSGVCRKTVFSRIV